MRPVFLVAGNFLRENRWAVLLMLLWAIGSGVAAVVAVGSSQDDALFFLKQQAMYSVFFAVFLVASALYNQRRSRRILAVLAKGIERYQYLGGIELGFATVALLYTLALGIAGGWTFSVAGFNSFDMVPPAFMLLIASMLAGTLALFFSTFMNPLFTLVCTSIIIGVSAVAGRSYPAFLPVYMLIEPVTELTFRGGPRPWTAAGWAALESVTLWVVASLIFSRKDIAVPVE